MNESPFARDIDQDQLRRARAGDRQIQEAIYQIYGSAVYTLARRLFPVGTEAEDILQDTFLTAFQKLDQYRGDGAFGHWLRRIAVNHAMTRLRKQQARREDPTGFDPNRWPASPVSNELQCDLQRYLARLPAISRAVLLLHDVEGYTHREIAEQMQKSVSFSKSQLARAHEKLRGWLKCHRAEQENIQTSMR